MNEIKTASRKNPECISRNFMINIENAKEVKYWKLSYVSIKLSPLSSQNTFF